MSEQLYSIKETTLTDIGDALRRKHGETKWEIQLVEEVVPNVYISKTPNATGFDSRDGGYGNSQSFIDVIKIPNATSICMKIAYVTEDLSDKIFIAIGEHPTVQEFTHFEYNLSGDSNGIKEFTFENTDVISIWFSSDATVDNGLGYYAEIWGLDENGNAIGEQTIQVEKEVEVPNKYSSDEMAQAIDNIEAGASLPDEAFLVTGTCSYRFAYASWDWFIEMYGNKITTDNILECSYMFSQSNVSDIPFDLNMDNSTYRNLSNLFSSCTNLKTVGKIVNAYPNALNNLFQNCYYMRTMPEFVNANFSRIQSNTYSNSSQIFNSCHSIRNIPEDFLKQIYGTYTSQVYSALYNGFSSCYALDEIKGINPNSGKITTNCMTGSFNNCCRLKDIIFATQEDGSPYIITWKNQAMDLTMYVGYVSTDNHILRYNSGITVDKKVTDDATYQALKNDEDWWTAKIEYSRYNHDSAVNTINSLPDTSAYLATAGGTNTIKFKGTAGSLTDGGAINTLTAEEIAVATAKGWTVTLS